MNRLKLLLAGLLCTATAAVVPAAHAQTVHFVGAGSSAMFQGFIVAAANDMATPLGIPIARFHHWSVKTGGCGGQCATINDNRTAGIPNEAANLWVVWATDAGGAATDIWAYASVDSTVGVRAFLAGAKLVLGNGIGAQAPANVASPGLLASGAPLNGAAATCPTGFGGNTCDDTALAADVITALGGSGAGATGITITAGMTDIRPEDAKYATLRALGTTVDTSATGVGCVAATCRSWSLGYGPGPVGKQIKSGMGTSSAFATPVNFGLPGFADPINTTRTVPNTVQVFPVGVAPIIFVVNRKNTASGLGMKLASDGSYYARNVWDQHPYPPNGMPPQPTTRRPLGNLFTGHDCGTDNAAFAWPTDTGERIPAGQVGGPVGGVIKGISVFLREPLSGTMNTTEFTEFRIYGTTNGNGPTGNGQPPLTSQEQNVNPAVATDNPLKQNCVAGGTVPTGGIRVRGIGTGEVVNGAGSATTMNGVLNTQDSIAYAFFSFSNVSKIATLDSNPPGGAVTKQPGFGYLMIDGIDPLFDTYDNSGAPVNPGQPAVAGDPTTWGELPACATGVASLLPDCRITGIWGTKPSYPHLRDGSYPAWSELRMMCDTTDTHCTTADPAGAQALVQNLQFDIHNNNLGGVPDLLPFSDAASGGLSFNPPYGDVTHIREHYSFRLSQTGSLLPTPTSTHESSPQVVFQLEGCSGGASPGTPKTSPPSAECGGDAGGLVVNVGSAAIQVLQ